MIDPTGRPTMPPPGRTHASDALQQIIQTWPAVAALGAADPFVAIDRHDCPAKPAGGLLERLQLVLDGLASVGGARPAQ